MHAQIARIIKPLRHFVSVIAKFPKQNTVNLLYNIEDSIAGCIVMRVALLNYETS